MKGKKLNITPLIWGAISGILICGFASEIFQIIIAWLTGVTLVSIDYFYVYLYAGFEKINSINYAVVMVSPYLFVVIMTEFAYYLLKKSKLSNYRFFLVVNLLIYLGFILFSLFSSVISVLFKLEFKNDFMMFTDAFELGPVQNIILIAAVILLFIKYFTFRSNKVENYISNL